MLIIMVKCSRFINHFNVVHNGINVLKGYIQTMYNMHIMVIMYLIDQYHIIHTLILRITNKELYSQ